MSNVSSSPDPKPTTVFGFPRRGPSVPWGPVVPIVLVAAAYIVTQFVAAFLLMLWPLIKGRTIHYSVNTLNSTTMEFWLVLISDVLLVWIVWLFVRSSKDNFKKLGYARAPKWSDLGYFAGGYLVYLVLMTVALIAAGALAGVNVNQHQDIGFTMLGTNADKIMALVSLVVLPPIVEEMLFRGLVFTGLRKKVNFVWATLITSIFFASFHLLESSPGQGLLWVAGIDTFILSTVLCFLREKTGVLWPSMAVHMLKNGLAFVLIVSSLGIVRL